MKNFSVDDAQIGLRLGRRLFGRHSLFTGHHVEDARQRGLKICVSLRLVLALEGVDCLVK